MAKKKPARPPIARHRATKRSKKHNLAPGQLSFLSEIVALFQAPVK